MFYQGNVMLREGTASIRLCFWIQLKDLTEWKSDLEE